MNYIHKVVWSHVKGAFIAVAEITRSQGKARASVASAPVQVDSNSHKNLGKSILALAVVALCSAPALSAYAQTVIDNNQTVIVFNWATQAGNAGLGGGGGGIGGGGGGGGNLTFGGGGGYGGGGGGISTNAGGGGGLDLGLAPGTGSGDSNGYGGIGGGAGALGLGSGGDGAGNAGGGGYYGDNGVGGGTVNDGKGGNGFGGGGGGTGPALVGGGAGGVTEGGQGKVDNALNGNYGHGGGLGVTAGELGVGIGNIQTQGSSGAEYVVNGGFLTIFGGSGGGGGASVLNTGDDGLGTTLNNVIVNTNGTVNLIGGVGGGGGFTTGAAAGNGLGSTVNSAQINGGVFNVLGGAGGGANSSVTAFLPNGNHGGDGTGAQLNNSTIHGGILNVYGGANGQNAQYEGTFFDGALAQGGRGGGGSVSNLTMTGGTLNLYAGTNEGTPNGASAYGGEGAKASNITNNGGTINLGAGVGAQTAPTLGGAYTQSAGALNLNGGAFTATNGGSFSGGDINVAAGQNYTLTGTTFGGNGGQVTTDATGGALNFTNATVSGAHLNLGANVTLKGSTTVSDGSVNLNTGGTISGVYTQTGGALNLSGGAYSATASTSSFSGGSINNTGTADTTLNGVRFTGGNVSTSASSGSELYLNNASINNSNVTIGQYVHLGTGTADAATINGSGGLINQGSVYLGAVNTTGVIQSSGDLTLTSSTYTASSSSFTGGSLTVASGGNIVVNNASFNGDVSTSASSGSLQLSNADVNAGAHLNIGAQVTLEGANAGTLNVAEQGAIQNLTNAGVINLTANSELGSGYTQNAGTLNFNGTGIAAASGAVFNGGALSSNVATTLSDAVFNGAVNTDATSGSLLFSNASVNSTANVTVGTHVTLEGSNTGTVSASGGTIQSLNNSGILHLGNNSTLGAGYIQNAGALNFAGSGITANSGGTFNAGSVNTANGSTATLDGATFNGSISTSGGTGSLTLTNADVTGQTLTIGQNVTLGTGATDAAQVDGGSIDNAGGDVYVKSFVGTGALSQSSGNMTMTAAGTYQASSISGGAIYAQASGSIFNGATITNNVSTNAAGADLLLSNTTINAGANLAVGTQVTLEGSNAGTVSAVGGTIQSLNNSGILHLGNNSTLGAGYIQNAGALNFAGSGITANSGGTFNAGSVNTANGSTATLDGATFNGSISTSGGTGSLTLTNADVTGQTLTIGQNVTLGTGATDAAQVDGGSIDNAGGDVYVKSFVGTGALSQSSGNMTMTAAGTYQASSISGGAIYAQASGSIFNGATITNNVSTNAAGADLLLSNTTINAGANLAVGTQVTLEGSNAGTVSAVGGTIQSLNNSGILHLGNNSTLGAGYIQNAGALNFAGSDITANSGGAFNGGDINAINGATATLQNATLNGMVNADGGTTGSLTLSATSITTGNVVNAGQNVYLVNTSDNAGMLNINTGASISGTYQQTNGILNINDASIHTIGSSTLNGGQINANAGTTTITSAVINESLVTQVASGAHLNINSVNLNNGVYTNYGASTTLSGFNSTHANYVQDGGTLQVNTDLSGAVAGDITIRGGTITNNITPGVDSSRTVSNVSFEKSHRSLPIIVAAGDTSNSKLTLKVFTVDNTTLEVKENTVLITATVKNNGLLILKDNATISGTTTLLNGGAIQVRDSSSPGVPGSITTTLENLSGQDGKIHFRTDYITGVSDHYTVNGASDGNFTMLIDAKGFGTNMELLRDRLSIYAEASFALKSGNNILYEDDGGFLAKNTLYSYDQANYKRWVLDRTSDGYSAAASSAATAATMTLEQVRTGMNELSKRLGDLRTNDRGDDSGLWIRTYGRRSTVDTQSKISMNLGGLEIGYDHLVSANDSGRVYLGLVGGMQWLGSAKMSQRYGADGTGHGQAPSVGVYGTWLAEDGWFMDATMRHFWTDKTLTSYQFNGMPVNYNPKTKAIAGSFEVGKRIHLDNQNWVFEPRAEIQFARIGSHNTMTSTGSHIKYGSTNSLLTNIGASINYQNNNQLYYVKTALLYEFDGKTDMRMTGVNTPATAHLSSDPSGVRGLIGAGLNWGLGRNSYIYADADWEHGSNLHSFGGNIGLRHSW